MTSPDRVADIQEALWATTTQYGVRLDVTQQVAAARDLVRFVPSDLTPKDVRRALRAGGLANPTGGLISAVHKAVRVDTRRPAPLLDVILEFRRDAVRSLSRQYGGKPKKESDLRNHLLMYLPQRGYAEAHTGRGQTGILLPDPYDAIVETKVWTSPQLFEDGIAELGEYIRTERPKQASMVVFGDREPRPSIVADHRQALADAREIEGLTVPVVVVLFDVTPPSKVAQTERRNVRG